MERRRENGSGEKEERRDTVHDQHGFAARIQRAPRRIQGQEAKQPEAHEDVHTLQAGIALDGVLFQQREQRREVHGHLLQGMRAEDVQGQGIREEILLG